MHVHNERLKACSKDVLLEDGAVVQCMLAIGVDAAAGAHADGGAETLLHGVFG